MTMAGMSHELVYRNFGQEEANRVYPKLAGKELNKVLNRLIEIQGYATEKQIAEPWVEREAS